MAGPEVESAPAVAPDEVEVKTTTEAPKEAEEVAVVSVASEVEAPAPEVAVETAGQAPVPVVEEETKEAAVVAEEVKVEAEPAVEEEKKEEKPAALAVNEATTEVPVEKTEE